MNINPTMSGAQPSFQAKLKENDTLKKLVNCIKSDDYKMFQKLLDKMENVSKDDTLELYEKAEPKKNPNSEEQWIDFYIHNPKKEGSDIRFAGGYVCYGMAGAMFRMFGVLKNVAIPKTKETSILLTEPAKKDQRTFLEKIDDFFSRTTGGGDPGFDYKK